MNKKKLSSLALTLVTILSLSSCKRKDQAAVVLDEGLIEVETHEYFDYDFANETFASLTATFGRATSIAYNRTSKDVIMGRNYDYSISNNPTYIVKTNASDSIQTIGIAYTPNYGPTFEGAKENGLSAEYLKMLPFLTHTIINAKGFYIDVNMRMGQDERYTCNIGKEEGTTKVSVLTLARYLAEHCETVEEAVTKTKELALFTPDNYAKYNFGFTMLDATGKYGVMEVAKEQVRFFESEYCNTNHFKYSPWQEDQKYPFGLGRSEYILKNHDQLKSVSDLQELLSKVSCSYMYDLVNAPYDLASEYCAFYDDSWTYDYLVNNFDTARSTILDAYLKGYEMIDETARKKLGVYPGTNYSCLASAKEKYINLYVNGITQGYKLSFDKRGPAVTKISDK